MGEDDPAAVIGNNANALLTAAVGTDLIRAYNGPSLAIYTSNTRGAPSSVAVEFRGSSHYEYGNNFGFGSNGSLGSLGMAES